MRKTSKFGDKLRRFRLASALALSAATVTSMVLVSEGTASASAAKGTPLVFGMIGGNTTAYATPEVGQAFQAYVANWNAHGGYKGHPIRVIELDGALSTTLTASDARTLVQSDGVIAQVDDYEYLDCSTNNAFYAANHVAVLGDGTDGCYIPTTDFPEARLGGSAGLTNLVKYAADSGHTKIALIYPGGAVPQQIITDGQNEANSRGGAKIIPITVPLTATAADLDVALTQAKAAGADAVISISQVATGELLLQQAANQNFGPANNIPYLFGSQQYDPRAASAENGSYIVTYGYSWTSNNPQVKEALRTFRSSPVKVSVLDGLAQLGYQSAGEFQQVLDSVKGPVTRASFLKAAEHATSVTVPLTPGFKVNLVHPEKDAEFGVIVKATSTGFTPVSGFVVTKY